MNNWPMSVAGRLTVEEIEAAPDTAMLFGVKFMARSAAPAGVAKVRTAKLKNDRAVDRCKCMESPQKLQQISTMAERLKYGLLRPRFVEAGVGLRQLATAHQPDSGNQRFGRRPRILLKGQILIEILMALRIGVEIAGISPEHALVPGLDQAPQSGTAQSYLFVVLDVKAVQQSVKHRRQDKPGDAENQEARKNRIEPGEDLAAIGLERRQRSHAG